MYLQVRFNVAQLKLNYFVFMNTSPARNIGKPLTIHRVCSIESYPPPPGSPDRNSSGQLSGGWVLYMAKEEQMIDECLPPTDASELTISFHFEPL